MVNDAADRREARRPDRAEPHRAAEARFHRADLQQHLGLELVIRFLGQLLAAGNALAQHLGVVQGLVDLVGVVGGAHEGAAGHGQEADLTPAHAYVAGQIAAHWATPFEPRDEMILAAYNHDAGWAIDEQTPHLNAAGYPRTFTETDPIDHFTIWENNIFAGFIHPVAEVQDTLL